MIHAWYFIPQDFSTNNSELRMTNHMIIITIILLKEKTFTNVPICDVSYLMKTGCGDDWTIWTGLFELLGERKMLITSSFAGKIIQWIIHCLLLLFIVHELPSFVAVSKKDVILTIFFLSLSFLITKNNAEAQRSWYV